MHMANLKKYDGMELFESFKEKKWYTKIILET